MKFSEIVAITGKPGLFAAIAQRSNGLIVCNLNGENKKFIPARDHMFSPLDSITIYTEDDSVSLVEVFKTMMDKNGATPVPDPKSSGKDLRNYFLEIVADHDQERVYSSDIKKIIKWYKLLEEHDLLKFDEPEEAEAEATEETKASE